MAGALLVMRGAGVGRLWLAVVAGWCWGLAVVAGWCWGLGVVEAGYGGLLGWRGDSSCLGMTGVLGGGRCFVGWLVFLARLVVLTLAG
ncbi:MAG: hypothetical protein U0821_23600 [Chloroflexota bacterium]